MAGLKLLNAQDKVLSHAELLQHQSKNPNIIDGLVQDMADNWVEGTFCNVFYQLNEQNQWFTPPVNQSGVNGVMRQVIFHNHFLENLQERPLKSDDLSNISALFFCNAVRGLVPIERFMLPNQTAKVLQQYNWTALFVK